MDVLTHGEKEIEKGSSLALCKKESNNLDAHATGVSQSYSGLHGNLQKSEVSLYKLLCKGIHQYIIKCKSHSKVRLFYLYKTNKCDAYTQHTHL